MRLVASFGSFRKSKSTLLLFFIYSLSGLGIIPLILGEDSFSKDILVNTLLQYPVLYLFPVLFLFYSLTSQISVIDYERDFIFSAPISSQQFFVAKTLYDLTLILFILCLPFFISFVVIMLLLKVFYILFFLLIFLILGISVVLENSFKVLVLFYNRNIVRVLIVAVLIAFCAPIPFLLTSGNVPSIVNLISPIGSAQALLINVEGSFPIAPIISVFIWIIFSLLLWQKASVLNFMPYAQVIPLRAAFDTSFRYQVQKQQSILRHMSRFSIPVSLEHAPKSKVLFFVKESLVRTLRFGDLYGLLLALVFLNLPYLFINSKVPDFQTIQMSSFIILFVPIFFPIILTQLWITEFSDYFWILKTFPFSIKSYVVGIFLWQLLLYLPLLAIAQSISSLWTDSLSVSSIISSILLSLANSAFGTYYGIWTIRRRLFTPYVYMMGMLFFVLVSMPILIPSFIGQIFNLSLLYNSIIVMVSIIYTVIVTIFFLSYTVKIFNKIEL